MDEDDLRPFESPRLMLEEAAEDIEDLKRRCDEFTNNCPQTAHQRIDRRTGDRVLFARFEETMPTKIRLVANRIVTSLRHALDQATCDAAVVLGRENAKGVMFPIAKSPNDYKNEHKKRLKHVDPRLQDYIAANPVHRESDPLLYEVLSRAGPGKHQRIVGLAPASDGMSHLGGWPGEPSEIRGPCQVGTSGWDRKKNTVDWARIQRGGKIKGVFRIEIKVVLGDGKPPIDGKAYDVLTTAFHAVTKLMDGLEAETENLAAQPISL